MDVMLDMRQDFIVAHLRSQINRLRSVLDIVEERSFNPEFVSESLKHIENNLKQIRKIWISN
jgi:hypothetical protein